MKFAILDSFRDAELEREICKGNEFILYEARDEDDLPDEIAELDGCLVWHYITVTEKTMRRLKNCKVIVRIGVGYDTVDVQAAGQYGIAVCNVPDYGTNDVADHCLALLLASCRSLPAYNRALHDDIKNNWVPAVGGEIHRLTGATLGIVGLGRIGHAVSVRARAFGMDVCYYDPYLSDGYDKSYQVRRVDTLEELFAQSDYVSIHTPLTAETMGMIGSKQFRCAKRGFTLVNTARGGIVRLDDVYEALKNGCMNGFAADVLEQEPPSERNKLVKAFLEGDEEIRSKVILTPHAAFYAQESQTEMREKAARILAELAVGKPLRNCVNKQKLVNARAEIR